MGVRQTSNKRLRAFISGIPAAVRVHGRSVLMCEINFLCVHKKLRSKRLAPVLIKEVTRRVNRRNIWQAVYTAGVVIPKPVGACRYWHRSLNVRKLIEVEFSRLQPRMTLNRTIRLFKLPTVRCSVWAASADNDAARCCGLCAAESHTVHNVAQETRTPGFRPMTEADVPAVTKLMHAYLSK